MLLGSLEKQQTLTLDTTYNRQNFTLSSINSGVIPRKDANCEPSALALSSQF